MLKRVAVKDLLPGMGIARAIISSDGRTLLHSGIVLTDTYINRLMQFGINSVYIRDDIFGDYDIQDVVSEETRIEAGKVIQNSFSDLGKNHNINIRSVEQAVGTIIDDLLINHNILLNLTDIRSFDDYTFGHSVNVCILSIMTGITMGYNHLQLSELGIGALLHDIGKIRVDIDILNKRGELNREEFLEIKQHPDYGFKILRDYDDVSLLSAHTAYQHHERWDGQGYPRNLARHNIHEYARITAVADIYDALLADRPYRTSYSLNQTLTIIKRMSGIYLDPACVAALITNIAVYPIGTVVKLSTGNIGVVVDVNRQHPTRPVIRIAFDPQGYRLNNVYEVDLSKLSTVAITSTLSEQEIEQLKDLS